VTGQAGTGRDRQGQISNLSLCVGQISNLSLINEII
jgi:ribosomal protein L4